MRVLLGPRDVKPISSDAFVRALLTAGFAVYRRTPDATILERGVRAVAVRAGANLGPEALGDLRRMAGLSWQELDAALEAVTAPEAHERRLGR